MRLIKISLLLILIGLCLVGRRIVVWPIMTWPMYGLRTNTLPPPVASTVELRVIDHTGAAHRLVGTDIFPMGRSGVARQVFAGAFEEDDLTLRDAHWQYLVNVVRRRIAPAEPVTIEGWRFEWDVDPLQVPPLEYRSPSRSVLLGSFPVSANGATRMVRP